MKRVLHLDQSQGMISVDTHLRVGKMILVSFITMFTALLAKVKKLWIVAMVRKMIGAYDQRVFWTGNAICLGFTALVVIILAKDHWKSTDQSSLLFLSGFIFFLFYALLLPMTKKDENGQSNWR